MVFPRAVFRHDAAQETHGLVGSGDSCLVTKRLPFSETPATWKMENRVGSVATMCYFIFGDFREQVLTSARGDAPR